MTQEHAPEESFGANVVISWATSVTVALGDVDVEDAFTDDFDWKDYDETLVEYLDSLSEEELRELYREPEAIHTDDPIFDTYPESSIDCTMEASDGE